jgi:hypothetical protein
MEGAGFEGEASAVLSQLLSLRRERPMPDIQHRASARIHRRGERLPALAQLREIYRRQRATNAPSQQLFKSLLGLEVRPRLAREASAFWQKVRELKDVSARDQIWSGILPSAEELLEPEKFLQSAEIPDDLSGLL